MFALLLPVILPVLVQEGGKAARRYMKERSKSREREHKAELLALRQRIERLEATARWA